MKTQIARWGWWAGVLFGTLLLVFVPYWLWNLFAGVPLSDTWWRMPVLPLGVFDTYIYFHWLGAYLLGYPGANHFGWFASLLKGLHTVVPPAMTLQEFWIVSRWISVVFFFWIGSWCVRRWTGLSVWRSRFLTAILWFGLFFTLGFRPGIYSWYWPFCVFGLTLAFEAVLAIDRGRWKRAMALSVIATVITSMYAWFFLFTTIWLAVMWGQWLIHRKVWLVPALSGVLSLLIVLSAPFVARWILLSNHLGWLEMQERNGILFSRIPFVTNGVIAIIVWILLLGIVLRRRMRVGAPSTSLVVLLTCWVTLLLVWLNSPFTDLSSQNDHFVILALWFGWVSVGALWAARDVVSLGKSRKFVWGISVFSTLFFLYVLQQPLRQNIFKLDVYLVHLFVWLALATGGWVLLEEAATDRVRTKIVRAMSVGAVLLGLGGVITVWIRELPAHTRSASTLPVIAWIRTHIARPALLCAEPDSAVFYAANTGYPVEPSEGPIAYPITTSEFHHRLETIAGSLDVSAVHANGVFDYYSYYYTERLCRQFARQGQLLRALGVSEATVNAIIACPKQEIEASVARMETVIAAHQLDAQAFAQVCPYVIIDPNRKTYWTLPSDYQDVSFPDGTSIWMRPE